MSGDGEFWGGRGPILFFASFSKEVPLFNPTSCFSHGKIRPSAGLLMENEEGVIYNKKAVLIGLFQKNDLIEWWALQDSNL